MNAEEKIKALLDKFDFKRGKIDLSLGRLSVFLAKIGNPHLKIPPVIHFAGTNGKGSTIAFLKAIIEADGQSCHVYTSPHLVRFNERIAINGKDIDDQSLLEVLEELDAAYEKHKSEIQLTFFELTTVAALMAFAKTKADYTLLETGMGGRYDATNLIAQPLLTIITPISIDHTEFLGPEISDIAYEKAGIIKSNVTCISAPQINEAEKVLEQVAHEKKTKLIFAPTQKNLLELSLKGEHQKINASTAIAAAKELNLSDQAINKGLTNAKWPARMQRLVRGDLADLLPKDYELWLDGAHNAAGAESLAASISKTGKPCYLIIGMLKNKDAETYLRILKNSVKQIYLIPILDHDSFKPEDLRHIAANLGINTIAANSAADAIKDILKTEKIATGIFICGSLYLAGHILKSNS